MVFSERPRLYKLATLNNVFHLISYINVNSCNVHVLYNMIFSNKFVLFWTASLFLYYADTIYAKQICPSSSKSL
jgi:hypothetical protein